MRRASGELFWCHVTGNPMHGEEPLGAGIWTFEDVSEKRPVTADLTPRTFDQRRAWVESHTPPYGVFVVESEDGSIIGFGALSVFYDRAGYDGVTDLAYYIDPAWQGRGVGTFMLDRLLTEARARHMRKACGIIFADNAGSIALMHRFGFTQFGLMPQAATDSTGTMRDMSYWHLDL